LWRCKEGHEWKASPSSIKKHWCPYCNGGRFKLTIEEMRKLASERGGKCLSSVYVNAATNFLWECSEGHHWEARPNSVKRGTWCPECNIGIGERISREFFEQLFGKAFPKSYPKWLIGLGGGQMELDGYCESLKIAFEHQGEQHYSFVKYFMKSKKDLDKRKKYDRLKLDLCEKNGVSLIFIPEIPNRLPIDKVKKFIEKECTVKDIPLPSNFWGKTVDLRKAYTSYMAKEKIKELEIIAEEHGGSQINILITVQNCYGDVQMGMNGKLFLQVLEEERGALYAQTM